MTLANIQITIDTNNAAVTRRDMDSILATYERDAVLVGPPGNRAEGAAALREAFNHFLSVNPKIVVVAQDIIQAGDIALHSYTWKMNGTALDGSAIEQTGLSVVVLRQQPDGHWLMLIDNPFGDHLLHQK